MSRTPIDVYDDYFAPKEDTLMATPQQAPDEALVTVRAARQKIGIETWATRTLEPAERKALRAAIRLLADDEERKQRDTGCPSAGPGEWGRLWEDLQAQLLSEEPARNLYREAREAETVQWERRLSGNRRGWAP